MAIDSKYRYNYGSGIEVPVPISETITVKTDEMGQKYALTSEAIQQTIPSTVVITGFTEITNPICNAGEFYVDYTISNNLILFNSSQAEGDLTINYNGLGTSVSIHSIPNFVSRLPNGSATNPSVAFENDNDTGIFRSAEDQIDIVTGGETRFRIESTGQIKSVYESTVGTDFNTTLHNGYLCRGWVNFNGTGTVAIRASGNVSSITKNGTGDWTVNFETAIPDTNYSVFLGHCGNNIGTGAGVDLQINGSYTPTLKSTSAIRIGAATLSPTIARIDLSEINMSVFR